MAGRKATVIGEVVKHTAARTKATCEISAPGFTREDVDVNILSPSKIPVSYRLARDKVDCEGQRLCSVTHRTDIF